MTRSSELQVTRETTQRSRYYDTRMVEVQPVPTVLQIIEAMERYIRRVYSGGSTNNSEAK